MRDQICQPTLFDAAMVVSAARSRRRDPAASRLAAERVNRTGRAEGHAEVVRRILEESGPMTYREIAERCAFEAVEVMRRLDTLRRRGQAVRGEERLCRASGNIMAEWRAI